jgi:PAS domain S-box-containing protein
VKILYLEETTAAAEGVREQLRSAGIQTDFDLVGERGEFERRLRSREYDVALAGSDLFAPEFLGTLEAVGDLPLPIPVICIGEAIGEEKVVDLIRSGAADFVRRDRLERLPFAVRRALEEARGSRGIRQAEKRESRCEERYRSLVEHASDGILFADANGGFTDVNLAACRLLGYSRDELLELSIPEVIVFGPENPLLLEEAREGAAMLVERELIRKDGSRVPVEINATRLADGALLGVVREVTERKLAEEKLRESEERYRLISSLTTDYFFHLAVAEDGSVTMDQVSDAYGPATGRTLRESGTPEAWSRIIHAEDLPDLLLLLRRLVVEGGDGDLECRSFVHAGGQRWVHVVSRAIRPPSLGRTTAIVGAVKDISERKRAEQALRQNEERFRRLFAEGPISMAIVRMDGVIESINRRAIETFGYQPEDIPDMDHWWVLAYPDDAYRQQVVTEWMGLVGKAIAEGGDIERREYRVTCKDRSVKTMMIFGVPVGDRVFVMFEDVTARRRAEDELKESRRELVTWHDLVTHDLANFSMTLLGLVEQVLDDGDEPLSPARRETLQRVFRQGFEMQRLAENAKLLARLRAGAVSGPVADADLGATIAEAVESVRAVHFDRLVEICVDCAPGLRVRGVPFLVNIFLNLVDNAIRYGNNRGGGRVELRAWRSPDDPGRIEVAIRGGVPPPDELIPTLFDRYIKGPHSSGSGLGLATVRELVIHAGGSVRARTLRDGDRPVFEVLLELPSA